MTELRIVQQDLKRNLKEAKVTYGRKVAWDRPYRCVIGHSRGLAMVWQRHNSKLFLILRFRELHPHFSAANQRSASPTALGRGVFK